MEVYASFKKLEMAIRMQCIECFGGKRSDVDGCTSPKCSLYTYRNGCLEKGKKRHDSIQNLQKPPAQRDHLGQNSRDLSEKAPEWGF